MLEYAINSKVMRKINIFVFIGGLTNGNKLVGCID